MPFRGDAGVWIQEDIAESIHLIVVSTPCLLIFRLRLLVSSPFGRHDRWIRVIHYSKRVVDAISGIANVDRVIEDSH